MISLCIKIEIITYKYCENNYEINYENNYEINYEIDVIMNGKITKYLYYESNKQSIITIPVSMAKGLNWKHKDEINIIFDVKDGQKGLFLFKKEDPDKD